MSDKPQGDTDPLSEGGADSRKDAQDRARPHNYRECGAKTRKGGRCGRAALTGRARCRLHGGLSTGPGLLGRLALSMHRTVHGAYVGQRARERWLERYAGDPEALKRLYSLDLHHEIAILRTLLDVGAAHLAAAEGDGQTYELLSRAVSGLAVRLRSLVEFQSGRKGSNFGTINNLQLNVAQLSQEQLRAALHAVERPELRPLAALLLPLLSQPQLPPDGEP